MGDLSALAQKHYLDAGLTAVRRTTLTEDLEMKKQSLEFELAEVNTALDALKANPEFQKLFDIVSRVR